ncbi:MAG: 2-vinyl bacteriochlorophyllide hydratase [Hyphomonadaceae bacterium]|nr:2-vinyl bacteriochlorophyllide hydratase [Hyphomonadaceae bacterium]
MQGKRSRNEVARQAGAGPMPRKRSAPLVFDRWLNAIAPCPWPAHVGSHIESFEKSEAGKAALYTPEERARRDSTPWTLVQAILAPLQFLVFAISLGLVLRFLWTGEGYVITTASILAKTFLLYLIMITGSIWEKVVFGKYLFARAFFWEDVFSMLVLALQTAYVVALLTGWGSPHQQMMIAIAAYAAYVINATQFLLKLREARLEAERSAMPAIGDRRQAA